MRKTLHFVLSCVLLTALIAALALNFTACGNEPTPGTKNFTVEAYNANGEKIFTGNYTGDWDYVGTPLIEDGTIKGENGPYGLYVKEVAGIKADYDTDGTYWAFYINGEYATSGIELTPIREGETYILRVEKG